jgi:hypothetical protein
VFTSQEDDHDAVLYGNYSFTQQRNSFHASTLHQHQQQQQQQQHYHGSSGGGGGGGFSDTWDDPTEEVDEWGLRRINVQPFHQRDGASTSGRQPVARNIQMPTTMLRQVVCSMKANFIIDERDNLWFSHCGDVYTKLVKAPTKASTTSMNTNNASKSTNHGASGGGSGGGVSTMGIQSEDAKHSAAVVGEQLRQLVLLGESRGVSVLQSFQHFDERYAHVSCFKIMHRDR